MGVGDIVVPKPEVKTLPTQLEGFESPSVYVTTLKANIDFKEVINVIVKFVGPAFSAIVQESELLKEWNPEAITYEPYK